MNALLDKLTKRAAGKSPRTSKTAPSRKAPAISLPQGEKIPLPAPIISSLNKIVRGHLRVSFGECLVLLLTLLPALWLAQAVADWLFNLPWAVRLILLAVDIALIGFLVFRYAIQPWRKRLTMETAALKVETAMPELKSALISAVQLSRGEGAQGSVVLVKHLISGVSTKLRAVDIAKKVVHTANLRRWTKRALVVLVVAGASAWLFQPKTQVLLKRILLSNIPLPTRTVVLPISKDESASVGSDVTLSAMAQGVIPRSGRVVVVYANNDRQEIPVTASVEEPAVFSVAMRNIQQPFKYHFLLNDGVGQAYTVTAKVPPALASFKLVQTYPAYTGFAEAERSPGNLSLLAGSKIRIEGKATQALQEAAIQLEGVNEAIKMTVGGGDKTILKGEFTVPREGLTGFSLPLVNSDGVASIANTVYPVELIQDKAPEVELLIPTGERLSVLLRTKPRLAFTARDDFALGKLAIRYEISRPATPGGAEPPVQNGEVKLDLPKAGSGTQTLTWDLSAIKPPLTEGSNVTYWIEATDNNTQTGPGVGESARKSLSIVSEEAKKAELLEALGARASDIDQIYQNQKKVNEDLDSTIRKSQP